MTLAKTMIISSLLVVLSLGFTSGHAGQYGAAYDESIPLVPVGYLYKSSAVHGKMYSLYGTVTAQCQSDGCWFNLADDTGEVLVDLNPFELTTPLGIEGKKVKVNGRVNTTDGRVQIEAISVVILE